MAYPTPRVKDAGQMGAILQDRDHPTLWEKCLQVWYTHHIRLRYSAIGECDTRKFGLSHRGRHYLFSSVYQRDKKEEYSFHPWRGEKDLLE